MFGQGFWLLDTRGVDGDEVEGLLLEFCRVGEGSEAVAALQRHTHGVAGQGAEMADELGEAQDRQAGVGAAGGALALGGW